jgi:hypothetical protein
MPGGSHSKTVLAKGRGLKRLATEPVDRCRVVTLAGSQAMRTPCRSHVAEAALRLV